MARTVHCVKLGREAEGLDFPPYPGELGKRIFENVSKEAWAQWLRQQTMLVNENRLSLADHSPLGLACGGEWCGEQSGVRTPAGPVGVGPDEGELRRISSHYDSEYES